MIYLPVETTPDSIFRDYIETLNPILRLRQREADLLEALLKVHYTNRANPDVAELLFSPSVLKSIRESLKMTPYNFNNHKLRLKRKRIIVNKQIHPFILKGFTLGKDNKIQITFSLNVKNDSKDNKDPNISGKSYPDTVQREGRKESKLLSEKEKV